MVNSNMYGTFRAYLKERGLWNQVKQEEVIINWAGLVGERIAANSEAFKINNRILWIKVKDSVWLHHLSMMKIQIIEKINKNLEAEKIDDLLFFVGEIDGDNDTMQEDEEDIVRGERGFSSEEIEDILEKIDENTDDLLKRKIKRILYNCYCSENKQDK